VGNIKKDVVSEGFVLEQQKRKIVEHLPFHHLYEQSMSKNKDI
tara:strand:- start:763 stop:891 length:129 start_codon:yes stop_codon:yes gene_type:complete